MHLSVYDLPIDRQNAIIRRRGQEPSHHALALEKMLGLERYFCTPTWAIHAIRIFVPRPEAKRWFSTGSTYWFDGLHQARWLLAFLEAIEPFAPSPPRLAGG